MTRIETAEFVLQWMRQRQGSPAELLRALEQEAGWPGRLMLPASWTNCAPGAVCRRRSGNILLYTLNAGRGGAGPGRGRRSRPNHQSSLDDLFARSRRFRKSKKFAEAVEFVAKFREYSPFNNMLVYAQNPMATHFATASHWRKAFGRSIKADARGMLILAPRTPVLMVYDIADTDGPPLPEKLRVFAQTSGRFNPALLDRTVKNCERDQIQVQRQPMGEMRGGFATSRARRTGMENARRPARRFGGRRRLRGAVPRIGPHLSRPLGADRDGWWPFRMNLSEAVAEIEAESVAYIVCQRAGLRTRSAEYLSSFVEDGEDLDAISLDLISRVAGRLEEMGRRLLPPRTDGQSDSPS